MTPTPTEKPYHTMAEIMAEVREDLKDRMKNPEKYDAIRARIEGRTDEDIIAVLTKAGIKKNSGSWHDYSMAKRILFQGEMIDSAIYEKQIRFITDYLGV